MKKINILCYIGIGVALGLVGEMVITNTLFPDPHENCVKITVWNGKSSLGNPDFIKIVDNFVFVDEITKDSVSKGFYGLFEYKDLKKFCKSDKITSFCAELFQEGSLNEVPKTKTRAILQYQTGALLIVPIEINNENKFIRSQSTTSYDAWDILDLVPKTKFGDLDGPMGGDSY